MSLVKKDWHQNVMAALELVREEVQRADKQIRMAHEYVDFWKVGKLNHNKAVEQSVVWPRFRAAATALLEHYGCKHDIKEDLRKAS